MTKKWLSIITLALLLMILAACGADKAQKESGDDNKANDTEEKYKIGVTQIVEHPSLNSTLDGFKKAFTDAGVAADFTVENAQGDNSANATIATNLAGSNPDLIFAISTPSAQAVINATSTIPVIFTAVTDAVGAQLVKSAEAPGGNVTGTVDMHPEAIPTTLDFFKKELNVKNIGMVYNPGEQNSVEQVNIVKKLAEERGMTVVESAVATSADVKQATEALIGKADAFYIITDNTVVSAIESVASVAIDHKLPVFTAELDSVDRGVLGAFGFDYYDLGYESGEMALQILQEGKNPATMPVQNPQQLKLKMNEETAKAIGVTIKNEWDAELVK